MTRKGSRGIQGFSLGVVKASPTGSQHKRGIQGREPTVQVDYTTTCKVQNSHVHEGIIVGSTQKAALAPHRVGNHGIDESRKGDAVGQIRCHLASLGECSGHNGYTGGAKGVFKEPKGRVGPNAGEFSIPNKGFSRSRIRIGQISTKGKGVTDEIKRQGCATGIQKVFKHGILDVLQPNRTRTHHGKARLHKEDHSTTNYQQEAPQIGFS
mmetsp:Transcript_13381/g.33683  ORF Transcript_13381/g.33683 Transcript_13381/m.33683 type:complete len:210 (-) Transcript_13381:394-1023(-)